ncbi:hypothetical protein B9Z35_06160 [Limnohabitans sp. Jir61]|nr:hypothetical protein B9Z35_06160 [Limnohabitans sp. Jir61]
MQKNNADDIYRALTNRQLSAKDISHISRLVEHDYEIENNLQPYSWDNIITFSEKFNFLYISGRVDINDYEVMKLINDNELTIFHEPYNLTYLPQFSEVCYSNIAPKIDLLNTQAQFINSLSFGKRKIGLHIRRGDYIEWQGGKYFYDDEFWIAMVKKNVDRDCAVFIFTNEINNEFHSKIKQLGAFVSCEDYYIDFVRMMLMNEIYGPPSTFSVYAVNIAKNCFGYDANFNWLPAKF